MTATSFPVYDKRRVAFSHLHRLGDWAVKVYTIDAHGSVQPASVLPQALARMPAMLPDTVHGGEAPAPEAVDGLEGASGAAVHGEAFAIVHAGEDAVWLLVFWWTDRCLLHRRMVGAPLHRPSDFTLPVPDTLIACSWELAVVQHERDAWVRNVQERGREADVEAYRADVLDGKDV